MGTANQSSALAPSEAPGETKVARRTVLKGFAAAGPSVGTAAGAVSASASSAAAVGTGAGAYDWAAFDRLIGSAFDQMGMVGAAVAVVSADRVLHVTPLGSRSLKPRRPVTADTQFLVASTTKSMTALLVATYVDEGRLAWNQPVIDAWSGFRAPTDELTRSLRVRDLLGMASGLSEPPALSSLHEGEPTAAQLLQSIVNLPVIGPPGKEYFYNNTVYAVGGYLPFLAAGVAPADLPAAYANAMHDRLFQSAGMRGARIADDPRGLVDDYATGYVPDLRGTPQTLAYGPVGSYAPVGGTLASVTDMAAYVQLQLRQGVSTTGHRVVSAANLAELYKAHIPIPTSPDFDPDAVKQGYAMGWIRAEYKDGSSLVWHNGGIDGFTTYIGFVPQHDLGVVVLNAMNPGPTGTWFYTYVLNVLLNQRLSLNLGVPAKAVAANAAALDHQRQLGRQAKAVDRKAVNRYLGYYEGGYCMALDGRDLQFHQGPRVFPLEVMPDGSYVIAGGLLVGAPVKLAIDNDGVPHIEIVGLETARRTTGL